MADLLDLALEPDADGDGNAVGTWRGGEYWKDGRRRGWVSRGNNGVDFFGHADEFRTGPRPSDRSAMGWVENTIHEIDKGPQLDRVTQ